MVSSTVERSSGLIMAPPLMTRLTVAVEQPAASATCPIVARRDATEPTHVIVYMPAIISLTLVCFRLVTGSVGREIPTSIHAEAVDRAASAV